MTKNKEKRKINYFKFVWVTGIFSILILILVIVIEYKVYYEKAINYLYFYDCNNLLCYTNKKDDADNNTVYSKYEYDGTKPNVDILENNLVVINNNILYNYVMGNVITRDYDSYKVINNYLIVSSNNLYGVIGNDGKILIPLSYSYINSIDGKYYIVSSDNISYSLLDINNNSLFESYEYLYEYNGIVVLVKDMKLSIKDIDGNNLIDKELEVYDKDRLISVAVDNNILYIRIYKGDKYYKYSYDIDNKKLETMSN